MQIRVVLTGRGYHLADAIPSELELGEGANVSDALKNLEAASPGLLADSMLVLIDGRHVGTVAAHESVPLRDGSELELLAPVAGG